VVEQGRAGGEILFDVVEVDDRVVSTLLAQPRESFQVRFKKDAQPPDVKIAVGDTISVLIWESAAGGLFSEAPAAKISPGSRPATEPLAPESRPRGERPRESATGRQPRGIFDRRTRHQWSRQPKSASGVGAGGALSVPYSARSRVAGRSPEEVHRMIEA
jgi:protein involved in polysaccharide export with SLBB domain